MLHRLNRQPNGSEPNASTGEKPLLRAHSSSVCCSEISSLDFPLDDESWTGPKPVLGGSLKSKAGVRLKAKGSLLGGEPCCGLGVTCETPEETCFLGSHNNVPYRCTYHFIQREKVCHMLTLCAGADRAASLPPPPPGGLFAESEPKVNKGRRPGSALNAGALPLLPPPPPLPNVNAGAAPPELETAGLLELAEPEKLKTGFVAAELDAGLNWNIGFVAAELDAGLNWKTGF
eukprot:SAG31_NODE_4095_length_3592_cov_2.576009_2_plen_232_part_00